MRIKTNNILKKIRNIRYLHWESMLQKYASLSKIDNDFLKVQLAGGAFHRFHKR